MQFGSKALWALFILFLSQFPIVSSADDLIASTLPVSSSAPADAEKSAVQAAASADTASAPATDKTPGDLWDRIRNGFALEELDTPLIRNHEAWYSNRPEYVRRMVDRSQLYLYHIVEEVEKRGMPTEIALLPMVESAFNPTAYSRSRASGIWQFIPSTGKNFGLKQNWWIDDRRDVKAATTAALDYLQKLHDMFGNWELALAAYNCGEGAVSRAVARNQAKGLPTDYLSLHLPPETRNYVPKLLAIKHIVTDPAAFGLSLESIPNQPYFAEVPTHQHMDVALAARLAEMPMSEFLSLNPAYNRPVINAKEDRTLLLPADKVEVFNTNLENYSKPLVSWQTYTPRRGEKLDKVARKFHISVARLKQINALGKQRKASGQTLLVPAGRSSAGNDIGETAPATVAVAETETATPAAKLTHTVKKGDTLFSIGRRYRVSAIQIKGWNHLKSNRLTLGEKLTIHPDGGSKQTVLAKNASFSGKSHSATKPKRQKVAAGNLRTRHYTVRRGDTLASIAKRFKVAVNDVQRWNNLSSRQTIHPGTRVTLILPSKG